LLDASGKILCELINEFAPFHGIAKWNQNVFGAAGVVLILSALSQSFIIDSLIALSSS